MFELRCRFLAGSLPKSPSFYWHIDSTSWAAVRGEAGPRRWLSLLLSCYGPWLRGVGLFWAGLVAFWAAEFTALAAVLATLDAAEAAAAAAIPGGPPAAPPAISPMDRAERTI